VIRDRLFTFHTNKKVDDMDIPDNYDKPIEEAESKEEEDQEVVEQE